MPPYQVVSRIMVTGLFCGFGIIILEFIIGRRKIEKERESAYEALLTVLNSIDATIYVSDMVTHEIIFMNQYMIDRFGGNFSGELCYEVFRDRRQPCEHCPRDKLLDEQGNPTGVVIWEGRNPVIESWYVNYDRAIKWIDGRMVHLQIATDITKIKELQQNQLEAEAQLQQAQKMESIGRLAGGMAHDFNNILAAITGYAELALEDTTQGKSVDRELSQILKSADRAKVLIKQILAFSRKANIDKKPLNLNQLIANTAQLLERILPKMISVELKPGTDLKPINGDAYQLEQVLLNLATNARDAMPDGGRLVIETENTVLCDEYVLGHPEAVEGEYVQLSITDNGTGMGKDEVIHVFEPFYTTKEIGKGTGLGLASVYGTVKSHGGYVTCYSEMGRGTTFKIYLPVLEGERDPEDHRNQEKERDLSGSETILLVDDDPAVRDFAARIMRQRGYEVMTADRGEMGLRIYQESKGRIDLVVMDLGMPGTGGYQAAEQILEMDPSAKIIIASGYSQYNNFNNKPKTKFSGFVSKPFRGVDLLKTMREVLDS